MENWIPKACLAAGALAVLCAAPVRADEGRPSVVVDIKPDRIILMDIARAGDRLVAVGERGFALMSGDGGQSWTAHATPVTRTLTAIAFEDDKLGVAVGHGGSLVRTEDGGDTWTQIPMEQADSESLLGVTSLGGGHFAAYGAFGLYFDSTDGGKTWQRHSVISEDFDRHISQVLPVGDKLLMVAESGNLAVSGDGGATWKRIKSPYEGSYFGATKLSGDGVVVFGMRGNVYRTDDLVSLDLAALSEPESAAEADEAAAEASDEYDEGSMAEDEGIELNWRKLDIDTTASLMAGKLLSDGRLLLVGNAGLMAVSTDNGQSLELHWIPDSRGLAQVIEADGSLIGVGERGVTKIDPAWLAAN
jgi:photosystem II stability/assembly factor-like uncharacterized protein